MNIVNIQNRFAKIEAARKGVPATLDEINARLIALGADPEAVWAWLHNKRNVTRADIEQYAAGQLKNQINCEQADMVVEKQGAG